MTEAKRLASFEVGYVCLLNYDNKLCRTYRLCLVLSTKTTTGSLSRKIKVGYKERRAGRKYEPRPLTEVKINIQRLALLVPTNKMEQLRDHDELLRDDATGHNLKELFREAGLKEIEEAKDEAPDELIKDVTADNATGDDPQGLAKNMVRDDTPQEQGSENAGSVGSPFPDNSLSHRQLKPK